MGRPRLKIDADKVEQLASFGASAAEIAAELHVGERTIERRFGATLKRGAKKRDIRLRSALFKHAVRGNPHVLIFMAKTCLGMRENDPSTSIAVTAIAGSNPPYRTPSAAEFKQRVLDAQKFLSEHPEVFKNESLNRFGPTNGD